MDSSGVISNFRGQSYNISFYRANILILNFDREIVEIFYLAINQAVTKIINRFGVFRFSVAIFKREEKSTGTD